jgi:hypothetical protein
MMARWSGFKCPQRVPTSATLCVAAQAHLDAERQDVGTHAERGHQEAGTQEKASKLGLHVTNPWVMGGNQPNQMMRSRRCARFCFARW